MRKLEWERHIAAKRKPNAAFGEVLSIVAQILGLVLLIVVITSLAVVSLDWLEGHEQTLPAAVRAFFAALRGEPS